MREAKVLHCKFTVVNFSTLEDFIPEKEIARFMDMYIPCPDCYIEFHYTQKGYDVELPIMEQVLKEEFKISKMETILIRVDY